MTIDRVLTNHITFRWDPAAKRLLITNAAPADGGPPRSIAEVEYATLDAMSYPEASRFIGEFVTLLMPELRSRFSAEFGGEQDERDESALSQEELAQVQGATPEEAAVVDSLILGACLQRWRKVALVVGALLSEFEAKFAHLPYAFMQFRILELVREGRLEAQGDVMQMRASEIRLRSSQA